MDIVPIYKRVIGLDVHQAQITGCAITEQPDGSATYERREFGGFKRDRKALAEWARSIGPDIVVMESTGIYWKSPYAAREGVGIVACVVNARHVKAVPGRKTDVADAQWLASLASLGTRGPLARILHCQSRPAQSAPHCPASAKARWHAGQREEPAAQTAHRCGHPFGRGGLRLAWAISTRHGQGTHRRQDRARGTESGQQSSARQSGRHL